MPKDFVKCHKGTKPKLMIKYMAITSMQFKYIEDEPKSQLNPQTLTRRIIFN